MQNNHSGKTGALAGTAFRVVRVLALFWVLALTAIVVPTANAAPSSETDAEIELREARERWQQQYRSLLTETARLRSEIQEGTELYAAANRRNYRRGSKRHFHREELEAAKRKLAELETELANFEDKARRGGALRGWLTQVETEFEDQTRSPAVTTGPGDEGRNPLHLESR